MRLMFFFYQLEGKIFCRRLRWMMAISMVQGSLGPGIDQGIAKCINLKNIQVEKD